MVRPWALSVAGKSVLATDRMFGGWRENWGVGVRGGQEEEEEGDQRVIRGVHHQAGPRAMSSVHTCTLPGFCPSKPPAAHYVDMNPEVLEFDSNSW